MKKIHYLMAIAGAAIMMLPACKEKETQEPASPTVQTAAVTDITENGATAGGAVNYSGTLTEFGICWSTEVNPTVANNKVVADAKQNPSSFTVSLTGLTSGTVYYVKAYATTSSETIYGDERNFTTDGQLALTLPFMERFDEATFPPKFWQLIDYDGDGFQWRPYNDSRFLGVISDSYDDDEGALEPYNFLISPKITISGTHPKLEWNIGSADTKYVEENYKVVVSTTRFTEDNCTSNGDVVFEETLDTDAGRTLLNRSVDMSKYAGKDVYIAWVHYDCSDEYALILADIRIGSDENPVPVTAPAMGDLTIGDASPVGTTVFSIITDDGGVNVVKRGFCYGTSANPTIDNDVVEVAADLSNVFNSFDASLDLETGKTYHVRAFAKNAVGVTYSDEQTVVVPNATVWFSEDFSTDPFDRGWTAIDKDGDGYNWNFYDNPPSITSDSYLDDEGDVTPENYLISPAITNIPANAATVTLGFQVAAGANGSDYKEHYKVIISENEITFDNCRDAAVLMNWTELSDANRGKNFTNVVINMSEYAGKTVYIGIVHGDCTGMYYILVRNLKVYTIN